MYSVALAKSELSVHQISCNRFVDDVKQIVSRWCKDSLSPMINAPILDAFGSGKFIRTRLAGRFLEENANPALLTQAMYCCAATEMVHAASLCHDDVIDGGSIRRGIPTMWRRYGTNGSILAGDLLFCGALSLVGENTENQFIRLFVNKVSEMCASEMEQEIHLRGNSIQPEKCFSIARGKSGTLFSFALCGCAGDDEQLRAFEETGYKIGTAYQLIDDILDVIGDETVAGKTLGTDRLRKKFTLAQDTDSTSCIRQHIQVLTTQAIELLADWPRYQHALQVYLEKDFSWPPGYLPKQ